MVLYREYEGIFRSFEGVFFAGHHDILEEYLGGEGEAVVDDGLPVLPVPAVNWETSRCKLQTKLMNLRSTQRQPSFRALM